MMKAIGASAALASVANAVLENCLYCRYLDLRATFLESWSYCSTSQECLLDVWNYIDRDCVTGWNRAAENSLEFCEPTLVQCPSFVASSQYDLGEELG